MKNTNYKYKEIKVMMEYNYTPSQHFFNKNTKKHPKMQKNNDYINL